MIASCTIRPNRVGEKKKEEERKISSRDKDAMGGNGGKREGGMGWENRGRMECSFWVEGEKEWSKGRVEVRTHFLEFRLTAPLCQRLAEPKRRALYGFHGIPRREVF